MTPNLGADVVEMDGWRGGDGRRLLGPQGFMAQTMEGGNEPPAPVVFRWGFMGYV